MFCSGELKFETSRDSGKLQEHWSPFPVRAAAPSLPRACSPRSEKSIAPHSVPHSPNPHAKLAGAFVIRAGFVASFSRSSSDYARRDKDGTALSTCYINPRDTVQLKQVLLIVRMLFQDSRSTGWRGSPCMLSPCVFGTSLFHRPFFQNNPCLFARTL